MAGNDKFRSDMQKAIEQAKFKNKEFIRRLMLEIDAKVIMKSPVGNPDNWVSLHPFTGLSGGKVQFGKAPPKGYVGGQFRHNWNIGNGAMDSSTDTGTDNPQEAHKAIIQSIEINGQVIFLTNSMPYAARLEYQGWSKQSPNGMVRTTIAELSGIINEIGAQVKAI